MIKKVFDLKSSDFPDAAVYDFGALESFEEFKQISDLATLICAVGRNPDRDTIVFGLETLRAISAKVLPPQQLEIFAFKVQFDSVEMDRFLESVTKVKGCHE